MKKKVFYIFLLLSGTAFPQQTLTELLKKYNNENTPYISVEELAMPKTNTIILDARELREYEVSHLKDALYVGYDEFDLKNTIKQLNNKDQMIVVYCSLGIRSEDIAEQLIEKGYTNVFNLFGGIFEWKNKGFSVYDNNNQPTENVHAFSKEWSKWLLKGNKIYD
ncbi:MAG: hypothetical protein Tsb0033_15540 [Winogradskyella sp.]